MAKQLLQLENVVKTYHLPGRGLRGGEKVRALDGVSLELREGESLGIVGESGCGKTTLSRVILKLLEPTSGKVMFRGEDVTKLPGH